MNATQHDLAILIFECFRAAYNSLLSAFVWFEPGIGCIFYLQRKWVLSRHHHACKHDLQFHYLYAKLLIKVSLFWRIT